MHAWVFAFPTHGRAVLEHVSGRGPQVVVAEDRHGVSENSRPGARLEQLPDGGSMNMPATILVVDDHEGNLSGLRELLQRADYTVFTATNGRDALRMAMEQLPDVVLLDVVMPDLSGLDVCAQLKQ